MHTVPYFGHLAIPRTVQLQNLINDIGRNLLQVS